jgi:hypothetical protein
VPEPLDDDILDRLREQLRRTTEAAERVASETRDQPPPRRERASGEPGFAGAPREPGSGRDRDTEDDPLAALLHGLRRFLATGLPRELSEPLGDLVRELLLALRALIDWLLERLTRRGDAPARVQDIPIA